MNNVIAGRFLWDGTDTYIEDPQEARANRKGLPWPPPTSPRSLKEEENAAIRMSAAVQEGEDDDDENEEDS